MLLPLPNSHVQYVDDGKRPTKDLFNWLASVSGTLLSFCRPASSATPAIVGELVVEATSNTSLTFKYKGSDGTVRSGSITLS